MAPDTESKPRSGDAKLRRTLHCVGCGYQLAGLAATGVCPECALPIERSRCRAHIVNSPGRVLARLRAGILTLQLACLGYFAGLVATIITQRTGVAAWTCYFAAGLTFGVGAWLAMTSDPTRKARDDTPAGRAVVYTSSIWLMLSVPVVAVCALLTTRAVSLSVRINQNAQMIVDLVFVPPAVISAAVCYSATMLRLGWMLRRLNDRGMASFARVMAWLGLVLFLIAPPLMMLLTMLTLGRAHHLLAKTPRR